MSIVIDGTGTISGVSATGISTAQTVTSVPSSALPAGSVLQVVNVFYNTTTTTQSATYVDTGLTATITPKFSTSKILVIVTGFLVGGTSSTWAAAQLVRNSTAIALGTGGSNINATFVAGPNGQIDSGATISYLDSPATTSATIYKLQFLSFDGVGYPVGFNRRSNDLYYAGASAITLMEIAQ